MKINEYIDKLLTLSTSDLYKCYHHVYKNFLNYISNKKFKKILVISNEPNQIDILTIIQYLVENKYEVYNLNQYNNSINKIDDLYTNFVFHNFNYCANNKIPMMKSFDLIIIPTTLVDHQNKFISCIFSKLINENFKTSTKVIISFDFAKNGHITNNKIKYDVLITEKVIYE